MNNKEKKDYESSHVERLSNSLVVKVILLSYTLLYLLASVAAFIAFIGTPQSLSNVQLRSELSRHCLQHGLIAFVCGSSFVLVFRRSKFAEYATGIASCLTGLVAIIVMANSIVVGFHSYHLIEILIIFPSAGFLL